MLLPEWWSCGLRSRDKFEITFQTYVQVGGLDARFQMLENKLDAKTSSTRSGRVSGNCGKKSKSSKAMKLRFQGIRSKNVGLPGAEVAQKRGDVAVRNTFRDFVLP